MPISFYGIRIDPLNVLRTIHFNQTKEKKNKLVFNSFQKAPLLFSISSPSSMYNCTDSIYALHLARKEIIFILCILYKTTNDRDRFLTISFFIVYVDVLYIFFFLHNQYGSLWFTVYDSAKDNSSVQLHSLRNSYHFQFTIRNGYLCSRI